MLLKGRTKGLHSELHLLRCTLFIPLWNDLLGRRWQRWLLLISLHPTYLASRWLHAHSHSRTPNRAKHLGRTKEGGRKMIIIFHFPHSAPDHYPYFSESIYRDRLSVCQKYAAFCAWLRWIWTKLLKLTLQQRYVF